MNLGITAAYGLLVVVFQEGAGARLFDFHVTGTTQVYLPLLTFAVLSLAMWRCHWRTADAELAHGLSHA